MKKNYTICLNGSGLSFDLFVSIPVASVLESMEPHNVMSSFFAEFKIYFANDFRYRINEEGECVFVSKTHICDSLRTGIEKRVRYFFDNLGYKELDSKLDEKNMDSFWESIQDQKTTV